MFVECFSHCQCVLCLGFRAKPEASQPLGAAKHYRKMTLQNGRSTLVQRDVGAMLQSHGHFGQGSLQTYVQNGRHAHALQNAHILGVAWLAATDEIGNNLVAVDAPLKVVLQRCKRVIYCASQQIC